MANLLDSKGDKHSPLDGVGLIRQKVKLLSIMAGAFAFTNGTNYHLEANVINGIPFMQNGRFEVAGRCARGVERLRDRREPAVSS